MLSVWGTLLCALLGGARGAPAADLLAAAIMPLTTPKPTPTPKPASTLDACPEDSVIEEPPDGKLPNTEPQCQKLEEPLEYCDCVDWPLPYWGSSTWARYLDNTARDYFEREYKPLLERNSSFAQCNALMKRLSCAAYFPRCEPKTGSKEAALYGKTFGPCGSLCRAVKELDCPGSEHLDCTSRHCCENDPRICFNDDAGCTMCGSHFPPPPPPRGQTCAAHTTCNACIADDCSYTPAGCVPTCTDSSSACYTSASGCPATDLACAGYTNCAECARSGCAYQGARCRATCLVGRLSASLGGCCAASAEHCFPACEVPLPEPSPSPLPPQELADQLAEMFARGA